MSVTYSLPQDATKIGHKILQIDKVQEAEVSSLNKHMRGYIAWSCMQIWGDVSCKSQHLGLSCILQVTTFRAVLYNKRILDCLKVLHFLPQGVFQRGVGNDRANHCFSQSYEYCIAKY